MIYKYITAVVATGLLCATVAADSHPRCQLKAAAPSDLVGNSVQSGIKSRLCWQDRLSFGGQLQARYSSTNSDSTDTYDHQMLLNHMAIVLDGAFSDQWLGHFTVSDVHLEQRVRGDSNVHIDEAMMYFKDASLPIGFKFGYGFTNFGEYNNVYDFVRKPTEVVTTNQQTHAGLTWSMGGVFAELYAVGLNDIGWGGALGFDHHFGAVGVHTKASYITNRSLEVFNTSLGNVDNGGTYNIEAKLALPYDITLGASWVKSRGATQSFVYPGFQMWGVDAAYRFSVAGRPVELHGWYVDNEHEDTPSANLLAGASSFNDAGKDRERFNLIGYNTNNLKDIFDVGMKVGLSSNVDLVVDYVDSSGTDANSVSTRQHISDFRLFNIALTGRF